MTTTTPTNPAEESNIVNDIIDSVLIFLGMAEEGKAVSAKHVRYMSIASFAAGWLLGIWRKGTKPSVGPLGF